MGADATLVKAAFKEAETRAGANVPNMKPLYDINRTIGTEPFKVITGLVEQMAKKEKIAIAGRAKQFSGFKESVNSMHKKLAEDKLSLSNNTIGVVEQAIRALQDEFEAVNTYGNNDTAENEKARYRIEGELNKIIQGTVTTRAGFLTIGELINSVNIDSVEPDELAAIKLFINAADNDNDERVTRSMGKDGAMVYTATNYLTSTRMVPLTDPANEFLVAGSDNLKKETYQHGKISMNMEQIIKALPMLKPELEAYFLQTTNTAKKKAKLDGEETGGDGYDFDMDLEKADILQRVKSKEDFQAISARRIDKLGQSSFREDLIENPNLQLNVIQSMFADENGIPNGLQTVFTMLDTDKDGDIDGEDAKAMEQFPDKFTKGLETIVNALTRVRNENFDLEVSRDLLADYYAKIRKQAYDSEYQKSYTATNRRNGITISNNADVKISRVINGESMPIKTKGQALKNRYRNFAEGNDFDGYDGVVVYRTLSIR